MTEIDIAIQYPDWETACNDCEGLVERAITGVFTHCPVAINLVASGVDPEISVVLANDDLVHALNRDYRGKDKPTNILSFAQLDSDDGWAAPKHTGPCALGDLVLAYETVARESTAEGKPFDSHFTHLIVHGTLHLLGYDHMDDGTAEAMESVEIQVLNHLGITNPYKIQE